MLYSFPGFSGEQHGRQAFFCVQKESVMISIVLDRVDKRKYATFKNESDMRESVNKHVKTIQESGLSALWQKKLIRLLDHLRDISRKYFGLSFRTQRGLAKDLGLKKPDTVGQWIRKLAELGIVKVLPTKRHYKMQQTSNFVQILPVETKVEVETKEAENKKRRQEDIQKPHTDKDAETQNGEHEDKNSFKTKTNINTTYSRLDESFTPKNVPKTFIETVKPFFGEAAEIYRLWGKAKLAFTKFKLSHVLEDYADLVQDAFKQSVFAYKHRKIRKDFLGYFYGTLMRMFTYEKRKETFASHPTIFNWLEDQEEERSSKQAAGQEKSWREEVEQLIEREDRALGYNSDEIPF